MVKSWDSNFESNTGATVKPSLMIAKATIVF